MHEIEHHGKTLAPEIEVKNPESSPVLTGQHERTHVSHHGIAIPSLKNHDRCVSSNLSPVVFPHLADTGVVENKAVVTTVLTNNQSRPKVAVQKVQPVIVGHIGIPNASSCSHEERKSGTPSSIDQGFQFPEIGNLPEEETLSSHDHGEFYNRGYHLLDEEEEEDDPEEEVGVRTSVKHNIDPHDVLLDRSHSNDASYGSPPRGFEMF